MNQNHNLISTINNTRVLALKETAVYWEIHLIQCREIKEMAQIERNAAFSRHKTSRMFRSNVKFCFIPSAAVKLIYMDLKLTLVSNFVIYVIVILLK